MSYIQSIEAVQILDSRGFPTLCTRVITRSGHIGEAIVPSGASTGIHEACELRDGGSLFFGKCVQKAISHVTGPLAKALCGMDVCDQRLIDKTMISMDNPQKSLFGANAILSISLAVARAAAAVAKKPLYRSIAKDLKNPYHPPRAMFNLINGGLHADNQLDIQEIMVITRETPRFWDQIEWVGSLYISLKRVLKTKGMTTSVGDEGGFAPQIKTPEEGFELLMHAAEQIGLQFGKDLFFALDIAASSLYSHETKSYSEGGRTYDPSCFIDRIASLCDRYPLISIEDPLEEESWSDWTALTGRIGNRVQVVGDDLFVTNPLFLQRGIDQKAANAILIKPNQIGTLTETLEVIAIAKKAGWKTIISHRSGDSEDNFIADLTIATGADFIKSGAPCRSERTSKYNRILLAEKEILSL